MNDEFLDDFFRELDSEVHNKKFTKELREQIDELDKDKVEELIKKHF